MPISGIVIRLVPGCSPQSVAAALATLDCFELGTPQGAGMCGVIDAPDYAAHDAALDTLRDTRGVATVDLVFHDFSDVTSFDRLPRRQRISR